MSGWFATSDAAVAAVGASRDGQFAVFCLYARARQLSYGPIVFTDRGLSEEWRCSRAEVWRVLEALHRNGLALLERAPPGTRRPSVVTVFSPFGSQNGSQNNPPPTSTPGERKPDRVPDPEPPRAEESRARTAEQSDRQTSPAADARARAETVASMLARQETDEPAYGMNQPGDRAALERAVARGVTGQQLEALWCWSGVSDDALVAGCRNGWRRWRSLLKRPQGDARIAAAWAWHEAGRPQTTGPPRARGSPDRGTPGDGFFDRMIERRQQPPERDVIDAE